MFWCFSLFGHVKGALIGLNACYWSTLKSSDSQWKIGIKWKVKKKNPILLFSSLTNKHPKDQNYVGRRHCTQYLMVGFSSIFEMLGLFESCLARHSFIHNKIFLWRQLTNNVVILERKLPTPSDGYTHIKMKAKKQPTSLSFTWYYCLIFPAL